MKASISLQGQNLTPDYVNVLRAVMANNVVNSTKLLWRLNLSSVDKDFGELRARLFHVLEVIDGAAYVPRYSDAGEITIFINGVMLDEYDALAVANSLIMQYQNSASEVVLFVTGFSVKHLKNLIEVMAVPLLDKVPKDPDDDEPIPD